MEKKLENEARETGRIRFGTLMIGTGRIGEYRKREKIPCWKGTEELEKTLGAGNVVYDNIERHNVGLDIIEEYVKRGIKSYTITLSLPNGGLICVGWAEREYRLDANRSVWVLGGYFLQEREGRYHIGIEEPKRDS